MHSNGDVADMNFAVKIAKHRELKGLSQSDLAELSGLSRNTIASLELDRQRPYLFQALALSRALDLPLEYLADDARNNPPTLTPGEVTVREHVSRIGWDGIVDCLSRQISGVGPDDTQPRISE